MADFLQKTAPNFPPATSQRSIIERRSLFPWLEEMSVEGQVVMSPLPDDSAEPLADDNNIAIYAPHSDDYQIIPHDFGPCFSLAWIN